MKTDKTVFVLGAGFSIDARAPSQEQLVHKIFETFNSPENKHDKSKVDSFKTFLSETLQIPERLHNHVPLEDIFTPLDKCISDNISFRNLTVNDVVTMRSTIYYLIGKTMQIILQNATDDYIKKFAEYITDLSSIRKNHDYRRCDPVSIISTNWDILLDNAIKTVLNTKYASEKCVVDYCCYISSYNPNEKTIKPGLEILGMGGFNVKLLKLHGSLNWLQCPKCHRLYIEFFEKIALTTHMTCKHCDENFGNDKSNKLVSNLIMPTYLKNLSNPQYKIIWQNAGIEISEASIIVFIGYSLPQSDFEMRQLLSRMVRNNARVIVVDFGDKQLLKTQETIKRYEVFFGNRINIEKDFHLKGAKDFINNDLHTI